MKFCYCIILINYFLLSSIVFGELIFKNDFSQNNINTFEEFESLINASPQIIELRQVNLVEEALYNNYLIHDFSNYLNSTNRLILINNHNSSFNDFGNRFILNESNFNLFVNGKIDRELLVINSECDDTNENNDCLINLKLACYDSNNNLKNIFVLPISITDINDNKPLFKNDTYHLSISENLLTRTIFPLESPVDFDSAKNGIKNCSLIDLNDSDKNLFEAFFNSNNQRLFLALNAPLDRENKSVYELKLSCNDGNNYSQTKLIINVLDANDNIPEFKNDNKQLNLSVYENELSDKLTKIEAYDKDDPNSPNGQLSFSLPLDMNSHEIVESFKIDPSNGIISLSNPLDYEKRKKFLLKVKVQDLGPNSVPIYTDVLVNVLDVNDNKPYAKLTFNDKYIVKENKKNSTIWINEELLLNNNQYINLAYFTLIDLDMPAQNGFNLSASLEQISFLNTASQTIEQESIDMFSFRLVPIIKEYNNLYYSLQLVKQLDRELKQYFDLSFRLIDNANQETNLSGKINQQVNLFNIRVILIDVNDNKPQFINTIKQAENDFYFYKFQVYENQLKLNFAKIDAIDSDEGPNSMLEYRILDDNNKDLLNKYINFNKKSKYLNMNPNYLFYIDLDNGSISLRAELDREQRDLYLFTVRVNDRPENQSNTFSNEILVEINILDENDNQPVYQTSKKHFELDENTKEGAIIGNVKAFDPDINSKTEYSIEPNEMNDYFSIDDTNGNLLSKKPFDAEDLNNKLDNNTFKLEIIARDPELNQQADYLFSKLNISIHLNDLNDNPPNIIFPKSQIDKLIVLNLNDLKNISNDSIILRKIQTADLDRDSFISHLTGQPLHSFKLNSIRRLSWQFIYEMVKNQLLSIDSKFKLTDIHNNTKIANQDYKKILEFLEILVEIQKIYDIKPISKVNLRSVFSINSTNQDFKSAEANLYLNQMKYLNWGVYNFSLQVNDSTLRSESSLKLFVFNLNYLSKNKTNISNSLLTDNQLLKMNELIDEWWLVNSNLVTNFKKRFESRQLINSNNLSNINSKSIDDNGDDIDTIAQEYYKFYSSNSFSSVQNRLMNVTSDLFNMASLYFVKNPSNSIIIMISLFLVISIILILFITYKYHKQSNEKSKTSDKPPSNDDNKNYKKSSKNQKKFLNLNQTDNRISINTNDQYDDINESHIRASKINHDCIDKSAAIAAIMTSVVSSPNRFNSLNKQLNVKHYFQAIDSYQQDPLVNNLNENSIKNETTDNLNETNDNIVNNKNEIVKKNSISSTSTSSSVTPITTTSTVQISCSSSSSNNQLNLIDTNNNNNSQNGPNNTKFLSTFIPVSSSNTLTSRNANEITKTLSKYNNNNINQIDEFDDKKILNNDIGYYGSSDCSDHNNTSFNTSCQKPLSQYSNKSKIIQYQQPSRSRFIQTDKTTTVSTTSSSLLSSPTSSSSSSSESPLFATGLTTNMNKNIQNQPVTSSNYISLPKTKNTDVKLYYERFERIYNSNQLDSNVVNDHSNSTKISNHQQTARQQRNSLTAYSYV